MDKHSEKSKIAVENELPVDASKEIPSAEDEFKVTVKKLELPVKPRGVLAE
jgi:hypothetical protein